MARIMTIVPEEAGLLRRLMLWDTRRQYGGVIPGIFRVLLPDLQLSAATGWLYSRFHMRDSSPMSRLQREMLAIVVNGRIGGAP